MRMYISSVPRKILEKFTERWPDEKVDVLRSFVLEPEETTDIALYRPACISSLILDSGTFSINDNPDLADESTVNHYREYLRNYRSKFDFYFNYDISFDGNDHINWEMQRILENPYPNPADNQPSKSVPVIQDLADVPKYCKLKGDYPLVAIGSGANKKVKPLKDAVKKLYDAGIKVHLLAIATYDVLHDIPAWSCDFTSFLRWATFRRVCFFDQDENQEYVFSTKEFVKSGKDNVRYLFDGDEEYADKYGAWLAQKGFDDLFDIDFDKDIDTIMLANIWHYKELARIITEEHKDVHKFDFDEW